MYSGSRDSESLPFSHSSHSDSEVTECYTCVINIPAVYILGKHVSFLFASAVFQNILQSELSLSSKDPVFENSTF